MCQTNRVATRTGLVHALLAVTCMMCISLITTACAYASSDGELLRFGGKGTNGKGTEFVLSGEETHAFAASPTTGTIYVGDETSEQSEDLRIQGYSASGALESKGKIKRPATLPTDISGFEGYEGFALAPSEGRIYVLSTYKRFAEDGIDGNRIAAGALYALKSTPGGTGELEPATGTGKEGLLGTTTSLHANSETQGQALLEPSGIAFDPLTDEVLILGLVDEGAGSLHTAVMHVSSSGAVQFTWVDPNTVTAQEEPDSPVVSPGGELFFEGGDELLALPAEARTGEPEVVFTFAEPTGFQVGAFAEELVSFGEAETGSGDGLSVVSEGSSTEGRLVADAEVWGVSEAGELNEQRKSVLSLHYSEAGGHAKVTETGWAGGIPGEGAPETPAPCEIGFANGAPSVAAGSGGAIYVLAPAWPDVIKLGPGGSGCLAATQAPGGLEATIDGKRITEAEVGDSVTLTGRIVQGNVLGVKWIFDDGQETTVTTTAGEQTQTAQIAHKFLEGGELKVEAIVSTDNLVTPELRLKTTLDVVEGSEAPTVTKQPRDETVTEGEGASFEATASGEPAPTVQWEVSTSKGVSWAALAGQTKDQLVLADVSVSQNEYEYRASFSNGVGGPVASSAATLTVKSKPAEQAPTVTKQPRDETVTEGEGASFEATASGEPAPTVQWEVSTSKGVSWTALAGQTKDQLVLADVSVSQNEYEYRASFSNGVGGPVSSAAATLTVKSKPATGNEGGSSGTSNGSETPPSSQGGSPPPSPTGGVAGLKEAAPSATLASTSLSVSASGALTLQVRCPAGASVCAGTVTLKTLGAVSSKAGSKKSVLTLAAGSFTVAGGHAKAVKLDLNAQGRKLLARSHSLRVLADIVAHNGAGETQTLHTTVTLRLAKAR